MIKEIETRRSIRKFDGRDVPREMLEQIVKAGLCAPSSKNRQPWRFIVTTGSSKESALAAMERGLEREKNAPFLKENACDLADAENTLKVMRQAYTVIFIVNTLSAKLSRSVCGAERVFEICNAQSIGAAIENMTLEAAALGLGSLWICNTFFAQEELDAQLGITDGELFAALAAGYADEAPPQRPRKRFEEAVEWR